MGQFSSGGTVRVKCSDPKPLHTLSESSSDSEGERVSAGTFHQPIAPSRYAAKRQMSRSGKARDQRQKLELQTQRINKERQPLVARQAFDSKLPLLSPFMILPCSTTSAWTDDRSPYVHKLHSLDIMIPPDATRNRRRMSSTSSHQEGESCLEETELSCYNDDACKYWDPSFSKLISKDVWSAKNWDGTKRVPTLEAGRAGGESISKLLKTAMLAGSRDPSTRRLMQREMVVTRVVSPSVALKKEEEEVDNREEGTQHQSSSTVVIRPLLADKLAARKLKLRSKRGRSKQDGGLKHWFQQNSSDEEADQDKERLFLDQMQVLTDPEIAQCNAVLTPPISTIQLHNLPEFGAQGIIGLTEGLNSVQFTLTKLDLTGCALKDEGAKQLAYVLYGPAPTTGFTSIGSSIGLGGPSPSDFYDEVISMQETLAEKMVQQLDLPAPSALPNTVSANRAAFPSHGKEGDNDSLAQVINFSTTTNINTFRRQLALATDPEAVFRGGGGGKTKKASSFPVGDNQKELCFGVIQHRALHRGFANTLETLILDSNQIGDEGTQVLVRQISFVASLVAIHNAWESCRFVDEYSIALELTEKTLRRVILENLTEEEQNKLRQMLKQKITNRLQRRCCDQPHHVFALKHLSLANNCITDASCEQLSRLISISCPILEMYRPDEEPLRPSLKPETSSDRNGTTLSPSKLSSHGEKQAKPLKVRTDSQTDSTMLLSQQEQNGDTKESNNEKASIQGPSSSAGGREGNNDSHDSSMMMGMWNGRRCLGTVCLSKLNLASNAIGEDGFSSICHGLEKRLLPFGIRARGKVFSSAESSSGGANATIALTERVGPILFGFQHPDGRRMEETIHRAESEEVLERDRLQNGLHLTLAGNSLHHFSLPSLTSSLRMVQEQIDLAMIAAEEADEARALQALEEEEDDDYDDEEDETHHPSEAGGRASVSWYQAHEEHHQERNPVDLEHHHHHQHSTATTRFVGSSHHGRNRFGRALTELDLGRSHLTLNTGTGCHSSLSDFLMAAHGHSPTFFGRSSTLPRSATALRVPSFYSLYSTLTTLNLRRCEIKAGNSDLYGGGGGLWCADGRPDFSCSAGSLISVLGFQGNGLPSLRHLDLSENPLGPQLGGRLLARFLLRGSAFDPSSSVSDDTTSRGGFDPALYKRTLKSIKDATSRSSSSPFFHHPSSSSSTKAPFVYRSLHLVRCDLSDVAIVEFLQELSRVEESFDISLDLSELVLDLSSSAAGFSTSSLLDAEEIEITNALLQEDSSPSILDISLRNNSISHSGLLHLRNQLLRLFPRVKEQGENCNLEYPHNYHQTARRTLLENGLCEELRCDVSQNFISLTSSMTLANIEEEEEEHMTSPPLPKTSDRLARNPRIDLLSPAFDTVFGLIPREQLFAASIDMPQLPAGGVWSPLQMQPPTTKGEGEGELGLQKKGRDNDDATSTTTTISQQNSPPLSPLRINAHQVINPTAPRMKRGGGNHHHQIRVKGSSACGSPSFAKAAPLLIGTTSSNFRDRRRRSEAAASTMNQNPTEGRGRGATPPPAAQICQRPASDVYSEAMELLGGNGSIPTTRRSTLLDIPTHGAKTATTTRSVTTSSAEAEIQKTRFAAHALNVSSITDPFALDPPDPAVATLEGERPTHFISSGPTLTLLVSSRQSEAEGSSASPVFYEDDDNQHEGFNQEKEGRRSHSKGGIELQTLD